MEIIVAIIIAIPLTALAIRGKVVLQISINQHVETQPAYSSKGTLLEPVEENKEQEPEIISLDNVIEELNQIFNGVESDGDMIGR